MERRARARSRVAVFFFSFSSVSFAQCVIAPNFKFMVSCLLLQKRENNVHSETARTLESP